MVNVDMRKAVNDSVTKGLEKAGIEDTNEAGVSILMGMHGTLSKENPMTPGTRLVLRVIEDEILELELG